MLFAGLRTVSKSCSRSAIVFVSPLVITTTCVSIGSGSRPGSQRQVRRSWPTRWGTRSVTRRRHRFEDLRIVVPRTIHSRTDRPSFHSIRRKGNQDLVPRLTGQPCVMTLLRQNHRHPSVDLAYKVIRLARDNRKCIEPFLATWLGSSKRARVAPVEYRLAIEESLRAAVAASILRCVRHAELPASDPSRAPPDRLGRVGPSFPRSQWILYQANSGKDKGQYRSSSYRWLTPECKDQSV
jgi:hypothetical protein